MSEVIRNDINKDIVINKNKKLKLSDDDSDNCNDSCKDNKKSKVIKTWRGEKTVLLRENMSFGELIRWNCEKKFFRENPKIEKKCMRFIEQSKPSSGRIFEHGITLLPRNYNVYLDENGNDDDFGEFDVAAEYFKFLPKYEADPCCRGKVCLYKYQGREIVTTIKQLNALIHWCQTPIFKYIKKNRKIIGKDLNNHRNIPSKKDSSHIKLPTRRPNSFFRVIYKPIKFRF